ncbi:MAG: hypothetical protein NVS1B11_21140 [Terriglobales bacterium]
MAGEAAKLTLCCAKSGTDTKYCDASVIATSKTHLKKAHFIRSKYSVFRF